MSSPFKYTVNPNVIVPGVFQSDGTWVAQLPGAIYSRDCVRISVRGPQNSQVRVFLGNIDPVNLVDQTQRGNSNTADYSGGPLHVQRSQFLTVQWLPLGGTFTGQEIVSATFAVRQADD